MVLLYKSFYALAAVISLALVSACSPPDADVGSSQASSSAYTSSPDATPLGPDNTEPIAVACESLRFIELLNMYRTSLGLLPLSIAAALQPVVEWHAQDMATNNYLGHMDSLGRNPAERVLDFDYKITSSLGENVAAHFSTQAETSFCNWKNSPGHNANMLAAQYQSVAVAHNISSQGVFYWVTLFSGNSESHTSTSSIEAACAMPTELPAC